MNYYLIVGVGLLAQALFSARILVQWVASERAKEILSPTLFWQLSMIASILLCLYGWLRNDFAIILGQLIAYYIYIWNLKTKGAWNKLSVISRTVFDLIPVAAVVYFLFNAQETATNLFKQENIPVALMLFGVAGQLTFTLRFIYQWLCSRKTGDSILPIGFWIISLTGSSMIIIYAIIRRDPVLILGQSMGFVAYVRNIMIGYKAARNTA